MTGRRSVAYLVAIGVLCGVLFMALFGADHTPGPRDGGATNFRPDAGAEVRP